MGWLGLFLPIEWLYSWLDGNESNSHVSLYLQSSSVIYLYSCQSWKSFLTKICSRKRSRAFKPSLNRRDIQIVTSLFIISSSLHSLHPVTTYASPSHQRFSTMKFWPPPPPPPPEIKKFSFNGLRPPWTWSEAPLGARAHSLRTPELRQCLFLIREVWFRPIINTGHDSAVAKSQHVTCITMADSALFNRWHFNSCMNALDGLGTRDNGDVLLWMFCWLWCACR